MIKNRFYMFLGMMLLLLGVGIPFLMIVKAIEPTFFLVFFTSGSSTVGLALGMFGLTRWSVKAIKKKPPRVEEDWQQAE